MTKRRRRAAKIDDRASLPARHLVVYVAVLATVAIIAGLLLQPVIRGLGLDAELEPITHQRLATAATRFVGLGTGLLIMVLVVGPWAAQRSLRARRASLLIAGITLLVGLSSVEILLRALPAYSTLQVFERSPAYVPSRFAFSHFTATDHDVLDTIDLNADASTHATLRQGYRGAAFLPVKPANELRIVILGGSHVYDSEATHGKAWPSLTENRLRSLGFAKVRVINAGIPGHTTFDAIGRLISEIHLLQPDMVVVCHTYNDLRYFRWISPERTPLRHLPTLIAPGQQPPSTPIQWLQRSQIVLRLGQLLPAKQRGFAEGTIAYQALPDAPSPYALDQFALSLRILVTIARRTGAEPVLLTQARAITAKNLDQVRRLDLDNDTTFSYTSVVSVFAAADEVIRQVAAEEGAHFFDLAAHHSGNLDNFVDLIHLTPQGSQALAASLSDFLGALLTTLVEQEESPVPPR